MSSPSFLSKDEEKLIVDAIASAEKTTSGELRVHIEKDCLLDPYERAVAVFEELNMHNTTLKNGVLIYLAFDDKKFAIIGDQGIHDAVTDSFWDSVKESMKTYFAQNKFAEGIAHAVRESGEKLKMYFPWQDSDLNELPNDISTS
ncbi:MAG: TPM domain-containing protein [Flavobacteriaceae bacterium]|nr:TPM domain-containing protein [Flavobacteriaceae bacterium]